MKERLISTLSITYYLLHVEIRISVCLSTKKSCLIASCYFMLAWCRQNQANVDSNLNFDESFSVTGIRKFGKIPAATDSSASMLAIQHYCVVDLSVSAIHLSVTWLALCSFYSIFGVLFVAFASLPWCDSDLHFCDEIKFKERKKRQANDIAHNTKSILNWRQNF